MKSLFTLLLCCLIFSSCNKSNLAKEFSCSNTKFSGDFEQNTDIKKTFSVQIPTHWKTNFFYNDLQSSIYFADTTKQLTETVLIDITHIKSAYTFDVAFEKIISQNDSIQQLINTKKKKFLFLKNNAFYAVSKGEKQNFSYQIVNIFIHKNAINSYHIKTEIYGDTHINNRLCKAIHLINTLEL
ncbi:hypothetical protein KCTC32516_02069 [Polaribacter huanghezhanensis]|uniref:hypothetical protein n=1 Tax=Polaribacter huanghezhanensis TaxID=1354726 RepID=UPI002649CCB4|nr:hypothetical protein [Polaribacter huanghezhanensis]WKD86693.1 hypothetical protein KCTC32516_02069 [Polaribacter huanghezhanensis]